MLTKVTLSTKLLSAFGRAALSRSVETKLLARTPFFLGSAGCTSSISTSLAPLRIQRTRTSSWGVQRSSNARLTGWMSGSTGWQRLCARRHLRHWNSTEVRCLGERAGGVGCPSHNAERQSGMRWVPFTMFAVAGPFSGS